MSVADRYGNKSIKLAKCHDIKVFTGGHQPGVVYLSKTDWSALGLNQAYTDVVSVTEDPT